MKKKFILLLLAATLLLSACGTPANDAGAGAPATQAPTSDEQGDTADIMDEFVIGVQATESTLDPNASVSNAGNQIYYNIYDTLIMRDTSAEDVQFLPGLALSWEPIEDLVWEIKLRPDVKFHDGSAFTAEDVAYSMNRVIELEDPKYSTAKSYLFSNFVNFEVIDELTVHAHTMKPEPLFEHLMSDPNSGISCKAYVESVGLQAAALMPITTGPYKVVSFDPGQTLEIERFDDYWGEKAPFAKVKYICIPEIISRVTAVQNGEVDFATNIPPEQEVMLEGSDNVRLLGEPLLMYHILRFDSSNPAVDDANLRKALNLAIDRQMLSDAIWGGKAQVATSYQYSEYGEPLFVAEDNGVRYDLALAKEYMAQSDYNGEEINIQMVADYYTNANLAALAIIDMWKELGVNATLTEVESWSSIGGEALRAWSNPLYYMDPMGVYERHWAPEGEAGSVGAFIASDEYIANFETARYSMDIDERAAAIKNMVTYYNETAQFIYLYRPYESFAVNTAYDYEIPNNTRAYTIGLRAGQISAAA